MPRLLKYLLNRLKFVVPQLVCVVLITFFAVRLIPGDPARIMGGPQISEEGLETLRQNMGLSGTLWEQLVRYVTNLFQGNMGTSWVTGNPVLYDIKMRLPATLQLIIIALVISLIVLVPLALKSINSAKGFLGKMIKRSLSGYGMAAGAFPDFWLALILIFVFYVVLAWVPSPVGQTSMMIAMPEYITGFSLIDSVMTGNMEALKSLLAHHILPVFVLVFVYGGGIIKIAVNAATDLHKSHFVNYLKICGAKPDIVNKYVTRASYPAISTYSAVVFGFLLGGTVLVEKVFSWGGFGQYAIQSVVNSDFNAIQGVVLVAAVLNLVVYIVVDIICFYVDPRIKDIG